MSLEAIKNVLGPEGYIEDPDAMIPYLTEWRDRWVGETPLIARPNSVSQVAKIVGLCVESGIAMVPQGGNTGLVGGAMPHALGDEIVISLGRMSKIHELDLDANTMLVDAGCILADVQARASQNNRLFPLSLAAEGSCQIGGNISTNAGGIHVLRYGSTRDLVLGLEVVLPDGRIWNGLRKLQKDNAGYNLKHLFIGAEGTLGIITRAVLKLFPHQPCKAVALAGINSPADAIALFTAFQDTASQSLNAFELIPQIAMDYLQIHMDGCTNPIHPAWPWYILVELASTDTGVVQAMESVLSECLERGLVCDAVIAKNEREAESLWRLRDNLSEVQKFEGSSMKHDISVPISSIANFIADAGDAVENAMPGIRAVPFGHVGDGNIHFNVSQPIGMDKDDFLKRREEIATIVHDIAIGFGGSISAEHGIGQAKLNQLTRYKDTVELSLMRALKKSLDPYNLMNPGKILRVDDL